jgi:hypothetical protein
VINCSSIKVAIVILNAFLFVPEFEIVFLCQQGASVCCLKGHKFYFSSILFFFVSKKYFFGKIVEQHNN